MFREIADFIIERGSRLPVEQWIGGKEDPYLLRRKLIRTNPFLSVYLQNIKKSDEPTPHDHRSFTISWILRGGYVEHFFWRQYESGRKWRGAGSLIFRRPRALHRLVLPEYQTEETWTIFITLPTLRTWGFYCPNGWVPHTQFKADGGCR